MNTERIGEVIKEIRKKNHLSQKDFAKKYGVTYQAVSKWETGKNIPDLSIIKQICADYGISLDSLLDGSTRERIKNNKLSIIVIFLIGIIIMILGLLFLIVKKEESDSFEFRTLSSQTQEFSLVGSIAYNADKTSIYISNVKYNGEDGDREYKEIHSTLYEIHDKTKQEIGNYDKTLLITFKDYINGMTFNIDNHASICKEYNEDSLLLEISATTKEDKTRMYEIPIDISDNCTK